MGSAYTAFGSIPDPRSYAFLTWADTIQWQRIAYCARPGVVQNAVYVDYVNGSDSNPGTQAAPLKTMTTGVQGYVTANPNGHFDILFARGVENTETPTGANNGYNLEVTAPFVRIGAYGSGPKPRFNNFKSVGGAWTNVTGTLMKNTSVASTFQYLRLAGDAPMNYTFPLYSVAAFNANVPANLYPIIAGTSSADVEANVGKWYFDAAGTDPNSGGVPTLYLNVNTTTVPGIEICDGYPGITGMIQIGHSVDGCIISGLRTDGWLNEETSFTATIPTGTSLNLACDGTNIGVILGCEVYWSGSHFIAATSNGTGAGGIYTFADNRVGLSQCNQVGSVTAFVAFSASDMEYYRRGNSVYSGSFSSNVSGPALGAGGSDGSSDDFWHGPNAGDIPALVLHKYNDVDSRLGVLCVRSAGGTAAATGWGQLTAFLIGDRTTGNLFPGDPTTNLSSALALICGEYRATQTNQFTGYPPTAFTFNSVHNYVSSFYAEQIFNVTSSDVETGRALNSQFNCNTVSGNSEFLGGTPAVGSVYSCFNCSFQFWPLPASGFNFASSGFISSAGFSSGNNAFPDSLNAASTPESSPVIMPYILPRVAQIDTSSVLYQAGGADYDGVYPEYDHFYQPRKIGKPSIGPYEAGIGVYPLTSNVTNGTQYGADGTGSTGTLVVPAEDTVLIGTVYGVGGNGDTGNVVLPIEANVAYGTEYGPNGNSLVGTLGAPPQGGNYCLVSDSYYNPDGSPYVGPVTVEILSLAANWPAGNNMGASMELATNSSGQLMDGTQPFVPLPYGASVQFSWGSITSGPWTVPSTPTATPPSFVGN